MRKLSRNLALSGAAGAVALLAAEGLLRVFPTALPEDVALRLHWNAIRNSDPVTIADPYLGFRNPADTVIDVASGETRFRYATDSRGFRNASPWPDSAGVVVVGDSQVFGWGVADGEAWVRLLDTALTGTAVMNLGLTGAAPKQYTRILERHGLELRPAVVVYAVFAGNDGTDENLFNRWEAAGSPGNYDVWRFFGGTVPSRSLGSRVLDRSRLVALVRAARRGQTLRGETIEFGDGSRVRIASGAYTSAERQLADDSPARASILSSIESAKALADSIGARFIVTLVPTKAEVFLPGLGKEAPALSDRLREPLVARGFEVLDLVPVFRSASEEQDTALFFEVDGHPNAAGNRVISRAVEARIRSRPPSG